MIDVPFSYRLTGLGAFALAAVFWDVHRYGRSGSRWREYLFLFTCGAAGALLGLGNDLITASISPEYFMFGKGIQPGEGFRQSVMTLGSQAGFSAEIILAGVLLFTNSPRRAKPSLAWPRLLMLTVLPAGVAVLAGAALGAAAAVIDSRSMLADVSDLMTEQQLQCFAVAWAIHIGFYAGALIGLIIACVTIIKARRVPRPTRGIERHLGSDA